MFVTQCSSNSWTDTSLITCARLEIYLKILLLTPLWGKTPIVFYRQNTTMDVLPHATGRFSLMFCATRNTKNTSAFDSKSNFLRIVLSSHCLWYKGRFCPTQKDVFPRLWGKTSTQMGKCQVISVVYCIVLWFYCHFIIERYKHYTKRTNFQI